MPLVPGLKGLYPKAFEPLVYVDVAMSASPQLIFSTGSPSPPWMGLA